MASWINSQARSVSSATTTATDESFVHVDSVDRDDAGGPSRASRASRVSRFDKFQKDLMAQIEDFPGLSVNEVMVRDDPLAAARLIAKKRASEVTDVLKAVRAAENVRVAFLVDTTPSMKSHIEGVKEQIRAIYKQLAMTSKRKRDSSVQTDHVAVAFVGYKDHGDGDDHFEVFPFTSDIDAFERFLSSIRACGASGDAPEDVNGGLRTALDALEWDALATNVLFHICDMPPHGSEYSNLASTDISLRGVKQHDEPVAQIFARMEQKGVDYYFGKITTWTDKMLEVFETARGRPITTFDVAASISITESVVTATTLSHDARAMMVRAPRSIFAPPRAVSFDKASPDWPALPLLEGMLVSYRHPTTIESILNYTELDYTTRVARIKMASAPFAEGSLRLAFYAREFFRARGSNKVPRTTARVPPRTTSRDTTSYSFKDMVCKVFKTVRSSSDASPGAYDRYRYMVAMEMQTIASFLAMQYNAQLNRAGVVSGFSIRYLKSKVLAIEQSTSASAGSDSTHKFFVVEKRLDTEIDQWVKVINNAGAVTRGSTTALDPAAFEYMTAFAHWTYCASSEYLMVTDLQGIVTSSPLPSRVNVKVEDGVASVAPSKTIVLTDPAIHCIASTRFGRTNLGKRGMGLFFETHVCNRFCAALALKTPAESAMDEADDGDDDA